MKQLILYSTDYCSLCDQALDILFNLPSAAGYNLQVVDVAQHDELLTRFGAMLPVLHRVAVEGTSQQLSEAEFSGPWQADAVAEFLLGDAESEQL